MFQFFDYEIGCLTYTCPAKGDNSVDLAQKTSAKSTCNVRGFPTHVTEDIYLSTSRKELNLATL